MSESCWPYVYVFGLASRSTASAEQGSIAIELNKAEVPPPAGCRLHFDVHNSTALKFNVLSADLVFFDPDGVVVVTITGELRQSPSAEASLQ